MRMKDISTGGTSSSFAALGRLAVLAFMTLGMACGGAAPDLPPLAPVTHPDLSSIEESARRQLEAQRERLDGAKGRRGDTQALANAFAAMGELYHTYDLLPAAGECYRNALTLDSESFVTTYYQAHLQEAEGDLAAAAASFQRALVLRPDSAESSLRLARVLLASGRGTEARAAFDAAAGDARLRAATFQGLAQLDLEAGDAESAAARFEEVLQLQPEAGSVHHTLGLAYRQLGRLEEAEAALGRGATGEVVFPDRLVERLEELAISSGAFLRRGNRALAAGRYEDAAGFYRRAVEADPAAVEARRNLAQALVQSGQVQEAVRVLREAIEVAADNPWLHHDLGTSYLALGQRDRAIQSFQQSVEISPDVKVAQFNLGNALAQAERWEEAVGPLEALLKLDPGEARARYLLAMAQHKTGKTNDAIRRFQGLIAAEPDNLLYREGLATVYVESRRLPLAMRAFEAALSLDLEATDRARLSSQLAELAWKRGQKEEAVAHYRRAFAEQPESSQIASNLANVLQLSGYRQEAAGLFAQATELDPDNVTAWLSEGSLRILLQEFAPARLRLEAGLARHPQDPKIMHTLARLLATCPDSRVRDGVQALRLSRRAFGLDNNVDHAETVAMAMAELGEFDKAVQWQRALAMRALQSGDRPLANRLSQRLALYERREPVRMGPEP